MSNKPQLTVAVSGLNAIDSPGPGIGVIRALRACDDFTWRIIGLSYEALEPGVYMHEVVDKSYQVPFPSAGKDELLKRLRYIHEQEKLDVIIPNFDAELSNFIRLQPALQQMGIATFLPSVSQLEAIDKMHLYEFGRQHGLDVPETLTISSLQEMDKVESRLDYPMVIKGRYYEAYIAYNRVQAEGFYHKISAKWGLPVIAQQFVQGTEVVIAGLGNGKGELTGAIPLRKLYITDKGKGWSGVVLEDDSLIALARNFTEAANWRGGFEIEIMRSDDDQLYVMEVNPRFPAWIFTTVAAGQNLPGALVKLALGKEQPPFNDYIPGKMFVRYAWDLITDIKEFEQITTSGEL